MRWIGFPFRVLIGLFAACALCLVTVFLTIVDPRYVRNMSRDWAGLFEWVIQ